MSEYPQPWDGMHGAGTQRDDWLLSLEDKAMPHRRLILQTAALLHSAVLVGNPAPIVESMGKRMRNPQAGDWVAEVTAMMRARRDHPADSWYQGFGILLATRDEAVQTDDEWQAALAEWDESAYDTRGQRPHEDAWYVQYGPAPGDICRWANCTFYALPVGEDFGRTSLSRLTSAMVHHGYRADRHPGLHHRRGPTAARPSHHRGPAPPRHRRRRPEAMRHPPHRPARTTAPRLPMAGACRVAWCAHAMAAAGVLTCGHGAEVR